MALGAMIMVIPSRGHEASLLMDLNSYSVEAVNVLDQGGYMSCDTRIVHPYYDGPLPRSAMPMIELHGSTIATRCTTRHSSSRIYVTIRPCP